MDGRSGFRVSDLNAAQRRAVEHGVRDGALEERVGPLLVIAGAGSGKTMTLAHRVARLILAGVRAERILMLTFTRRAAQEMSRRAERLVARALADAAHEQGEAGGAEGSPPALERGALARTSEGGASVPRAARVTWAGTFHAVGNRLLRLYASTVGLDPAFTVLDRSDAADLLDLLRSELGLDRKAARFPRKGTCLAIYSQVVNTRRGLDSVLREAFPWCEPWREELPRLFRAYVEAKQRQHTLDYDDLLLWWRQMMDEPSLAAAIGARFDHVLVDEYQDTNALQAEILCALKPDGAGVTAVGDDAQAIYSFRGATVRNILDFPSRYDPPARVVTLERNYRSTPAILDASNAVMRGAAERYTKDLVATRTSARRPLLATVSDETEQVEYVVARVLAAREAGVDLRRQAVLFRAAHHSDALEVELVRRNLPFVKFGGLKFLEAAHVKDVLCVLRWAENPRDAAAAFRVLQLLPGVGPAIAMRAMQAYERGGFETAALWSFRPPAAAAQEWPALVSLVAKLRDPGAAWQGQVAAVLAWYDPHLERMYDAAHVRRGDLEQLDRIAASYGARERFLTELTLDPPSATGDRAGPPLLDEDYLVLSTIHSAKGQEWDAVYVLNVVDGCIPSDMTTGSPAQVEEERRLLYVAMTRARDELHLVQPLRFYVHGQARGGDRHVYAPRSRFLTDEVVRLLEPCTGAGGASPDETLAPSRPLPRADIGSRVRAMW